MREYFRNNSVTLSKQKRTLSLFQKIMNGARCRVRTSRKSLENQGVTPDDTLQNTFDSDPPWKEPTDGAETLDLSINRRKRSAAERAEGRGSPRPIGQSAGAGAKPELPVCGQVGSVSGVITAGVSVLFCPELREIAETWPTLPQSFKSAVLGIVRSAKREGEECV